MRLSLLLGWGRGCGASACVHKGHGPAARARSQTGKLLVFDVMLLYIMLDVLCMSGILLVSIVPPPQRASRGLRRLAYKASGRNDFCLKRASLSLCTCVHGRARGSGTHLVQRQTKVTNHMATKIAIIANQLNEDLVAVMTSSHDNTDTRCWCTCWLAQVIWCIGSLKVMRTH